MRRLLADLEDALHFVAGGMIGGQAGLGQRGHAHDDRQEVIEIVNSSAGDAAD